jgi:hypothetical protein
MESFAAARCSQHICTSCRCCMWSARSRARLAGVAVAAVGACAPAIEPHERSAPDVLAGAQLRHASSGATRCEAAAGSCTDVWVKSGAGPDISAVLADPSVKGFVGLTEYAWDFADPNGAPGFGPLNADEAERLVALMTMGNAPPPFDSSTQYASLQSVRISEDFDPSTQSQKSLE